MREFKLPDPGEGLVEADIVTWRVKAGDEVKINDVVVEVETSKSIVELPIPFAGVVTELLVAEGDTVEVGAPIITIDDGSGDAPAADGDGEERVANLVGYGARAGASKRRPRKQSEPAAEAHAAVASSFGTGDPVSRRIDERAPLAAAPVGEESHAASLPTPGEAETEPGVASGRLLAKPPVRKLAKDLGVDLAAVEPTGDGGIITRDDVINAAQTPAADPDPVGRPWTATSGDQGADVRIPIKGVRKATAAAVTGSAFTVPHVTEWVSVDVTASMELLERLRARREFRDLRLSPLLLVCKAVIAALSRTPELNSSWDEAAAEIVQHREINLGIAAATPRGLIVPNLKGAQRLGLRELAEAMAGLVATAREGKTQPAQMSGGTFTITNIGVFGVDGGTPILNPGESGVLAVGQIARRPWVVGTGADERIEPRWVTTLAVSFDHRIADGEQGSRFLADVAGVLADPGLALMF